MQASGAVRRATASLLAVHKEKTPRNFLGIQYIIAKALVLLSALGKGSDGSDPLVAHRTAIGHIGDATAAIVPFSTIASRADRVAIPPQLAPPVPVWLLLPRNRGL